MMETTGGILGQQSTGRKIKTIRIGQRDRRIIIERATITNTVTGAPRMVWNQLAVVWANVHDFTRLTENNELNQVVAQNETTFIMRKRDINEKDRIVYRGKPHDIIGIEEIGRNDLLSIKTFVNKTP